MPGHLPFRFDGGLIMDKIFYVRHQAHGVVHEFPFAQSPSDEQIELVRKFCFQLHGFGHAKTPDEPYWVRIVEVAVFGPKDLPEVPDRDLSVVGEPGTAKSKASPFVAHGTGVVGEGKK